MSATLGVPDALERGTKSEVAPSGPGGYITFATLGVPNISERGTKSAVSHKWAGWLHNVCHLGGPRRFTSGDQLADGEAHTPHFRSAVAGSRLDATNCISNKSVNPHTEACQQALNCCIDAQRTLGGVMDSSSNYFSTINQSKMPQQVARKKRGKMW